MNDDGKNHSAVERSWAVPTVHRGQMKRANGDRRTLLQYDLSYRQERSRIY